MSLNVRAPGSRLARGMRTSLSRIRAWCIGAERRLSGDGLGLVSLPVLLHQEAADIAGVIACPDHGDIPHRAVADPLLLAVEDVLPAVEGGGGFQCHGVRAVVRFRQGEGAELFAPAQRTKPGLALGFGPEECNRAHGQAALDCDHGTQRTVPAGDFHVDQSGAQGRHQVQARDVKAVGQQVQAAHPLRQVGGELGALPVVVHLRHCLRCEGPGAVPDFTVGGRNIRKDGVVVGIEWFGDVIVGHGLHPLGRN